MKCRKPQASDQEKISRAKAIFSLIIQTNSQEIEPCLWLPATMSKLAENYRYSNVPYEYFEQEVLNCLKHYEY